MVDFLIGLFLATLITALFTTRLYRLLFWYSLNSLTLGLLALVLGSELGDRAMLISGTLTILLKALAIPYILKYLSQKFQLVRQVPPSIKTQYAIMLVPAILVFTFYLAEPISHMVQGNANYVAVSISSLFLSLLLMIEHRNIAPKIVGFLSMENALFLLGTTATGGMPMLVELGIFFDLLMAIVVINLLLYREEAES
ncbi:hydrogenase [Nitratifractor salsuginis]|uniref:Ni-Fe hydrogenase, membrane subunit HyfE n=1 Tax=Nitratifractor salsuginis (strain DSM 16511 / JCM 12458 / E9I37-1) TaxID=749222 RepID=E6X222_NITSE|nr:hydrogenase [Nitratifractor salsuginis]ADV47091.1 Ni-Fe hydrogenase, membrane subunit HyfE [Nitratifractor salsuginis DSM 16511]